MTTTARSGSSPVEAAGFAEVGIGLRSIDVMTHEGSAARHPSKKRPSWGNVAPPRSSVARWRMSGAAVPEVGAATSGERLTSVDAGRPLDARTAETRG